LLDLTGTGTKQNAEVHGWRRLGFGMVVRPCQLRTGRHYYIEEQVAQAVVDGAPKDAIFKDTEGVWHTLADLQRQAPEAAG
jgi:hypothetical protein